MSRIHEIKDFVQAYAENMAEILGLDVTILDENCNRISGTGSYRDLIGNPAPQGSFFEKILKTGQPGIILETKKNESQCSRCMFIDQCNELATIGAPIFQGNRIVGVIGLIGFTPQQRKIIINNSPQLINFLNHISTLLEHKLLAFELRPAVECQVQEIFYQPKPQSYFSKIVGSDTTLIDLIKRAKKITNSISTVLISGESGTGKELLAQAIHYEGNRSQYPLVTVNCAAIPEHLLESELFGYEGGAFTGARREGSMGKFERAHQGTIFLDEIGDLPLSLQPKLLRVLQERKVERVGGQRSIPVDVRVIVATNKDLAKMVEEGTFREDLFYRLHVIPLHLPPLNERREDLHLYVKHFINKYNHILTRDIRGINQGLAAWIEQYDWPGNIRQLENTIEYMINMAEHSVLTVENLPEYLQKEKDPTFESRDIGLEEMMSIYERNVLMELLMDESYKRDKSALAEKLKISLSTLYRKLEKYEIGH